MKIRPVGIEALHVDGRTAGHEKDNSRFSQCWESSYKKVILIYPMLPNFWDSISFREVRPFALLVKSTYR